MYYKFETAVMKSEIISTANEFTKKSKIEFERTQYTNTYLLSNSRIFSKNVFIRNVFLTWAQKNLSNDNYVHT